jgi:hypothetical protein
MPNIENVLKSDPELMKQFQQAAAKQYVMGNNYPSASSASLPQQQQQQNIPMSNSYSSGSDSSSGLFGMVSSLFSTLNSPVSSMSMPSMQSASNNVNMRQSPNITELRHKPSADIENIINNVHNNISMDHNDNNIETLSVSDEEITSIIEDTADIKILRGVGRPRKNTRTLNI